ncbi:hypothetical protein AJ88_24225 [Mesorhizobium amorphae CCBAU 01583]|nr:hypothetical protein AJ88_24225 [Mesorhizobium amorphae CCBAU 01583]
MEPLSICRAVADDAPPLPSPRFGQIKIRWPARPLQFMLIVAVELVWLLDSVSTAPKFMLETLKLQLCARRATEPRPRSGG